MYHLGLQKWGDRASAFPPHPAPALGAPPRVLSLQGSSGQACGHSVGGCWRACGLVSSAVLGQKPWVSSPPLMWLWWELSVDDTPCTVGPGVTPGAPADPPFGCRPQLCSPNPASPAGRDLGPRLRAIACWTDLDQTWLIQTREALSLSSGRCPAPTRCSASFTGWDEGEWVVACLRRPPTVAPRGPVLSTQPLSPASSRLDLAERSSDARGRHLLPALRLCLRLARPGGPCPGGQRR